MTRLDAITIKYKNENYEYEKNTTLLEVSEKFKGDFKDRIIVATVDNRLSSLESKLTRNCSVNFYDINSVLGNRTYLRGVYFLFSKAVKDVINCDVKIMHVIEKGTYCEVLTNELISEVTVEKIKIRMRELSESKLPITKIMVSRLDAIDYFDKINQKDKADSLRFISNSSISLYKLGDTLDYFYGVLPCNTSYFDKFNVKYLKDNKVILLAPYLYDTDDKLKYEKNDMLIGAVEKHDRYLEALGINTSVELNRTISNGNYGEIIRISESLQNNRMFEIVNKITKNKDTKMVLITGPSSSGKTTTSKKLSLFLRSKGYDPIPISVDDFYVNLEDRVLNDKGEPEKESIDAIDTNQFNKKISELLNGEKVHLPRYNFIKGKQEFSDKVTKMNENSILIIEGIHAFNEKLTEMIPDGNKFKLYICPLTPLNVDNHNLFTSNDNRLLRRIVRDNRTRGVSASQTLALWRSVRDAEETTIFPYVKDADEVLNTSLVYELGVLRTYAEPLLFSVSEDDVNYDDAIRLINLFRVILGIPSDDVPNDSIIREFIGGSCFKE